MTMKGGSEKIMFRWFLVFGFVLVSVLSSTSNVDGNVTNSTWQFTNSDDWIDFMDESSPMPPLFPFNWKDYLGFSFTVLGLLLAAGGGIGGGAILIPIYILLLDFPVKHAIPIASATVLGGAIANNALNWSKKHPEHPSRTCIDWDLILIMEPATMAGSLLGANMNEFLPEIALVILLLILLSFTAHKTLSKARKLYEEESLSMNRKGEETVPLHSKEDALARTLQSDIAYGSALEKDPKTVLEVARQETSFDPWYEQKTLIDVSKLVALFAVTTLISLFKGGTSDGGGPLGFKECGLECFWMSQVVILAIIVGFTIHVRSTLLRRIREGRASTSDISWNKSNTVTYSLFAITAGLVAGMFGIGGGIIKGPLMLALGVHPAVASATSAAMIFFTAATATVSYSIFGLLVYDYAAFCLLVGLVSTLAGQLLMAELLKKYNRNSYIAFSIGYVVAISAVCMTLESIIFLVREKH